MLLLTWNIGKVYKVGNLFCLHDPKSYRHYYFFFQTCRFVETLTNRRGNAGLQHAKLNYDQGYANKLNSNNQQNHILKSRSTCIHDTRPTTDKIF